ncbi:MAG: dihydrodipicolinate reductase [Firmicutes bacterium HGW-Firmicutes-16]|nr:MAG: dihydrodipicolinate reductase [Firmicutes bacterium HGW-Firmicutes-16]
MKLSIGLFGFGKTGSIVANEIIKENDCELKWVVRKSSVHEGTYASRHLGYDHDEGIIHSINNIDFTQFYKENKVDVIIDFSSSSAVDEYKNAAQYGTRIVSAISKYNGKEFELLKELSDHTAVLYSPNITLGVNFLIEASKVLQSIAPHADIEIIEEHFKGKKGVSGTAIRIADDLGLDREKNIHSIRVGGTIGRHEVVFGLPNQTIRIIHESINRAAFGQGAIYAAKWIMTHAKGMYSMEQALSLSMAIQSRNPNIK